jgi:hypothetical protein
MKARAAIAIVAATLVVGTLDALDAIIFFGFRGASSAQIFQSIASGVLGRSAFEGERTNVGMGVALHYLIAFLIVVVFFIFSRRLRYLTAHPVASGLAYGVAVYFTMTYVVVPLSAAVQGPFSLPVFVNGVLIHMFGVGLPTALIVRRA